MDKIKNFVAENRVVLLICIVLFLLICWLHTDSHKNDGQYHNTDNTVADLEKRINHIEQRIDTMSERHEKIEKTVSGVTETIRDSRENAVTVADGISGTEARLNDAIQRSGRIQNLIADIENANKQGTKNP